MELRLKFEDILAVIVYICLFLLLINVFVYGVSPNNYTLDAVQVECLFDSEQEILSNYDIDLGSQEIVNDLVNDVSSTEITNETIDSIEDLTIQGIETLTFEEFKDNYTVKNRMAGKVLQTREGLDGFNWPLENYSSISSYFENRVHPITGKWHKHSGVDIPAPEGTPICASKAGVIISSHYDNSYGNFVLIEHYDSTCTLYAHMVAPGLKKGLEVQQGTVIGNVGTTGSSTGNHLHFEIWRSNDSSQKVNPLDYFDFA